MKLTKIIAGFLFLVIIIIGGIQYMKANPTKAQTSYLVEGLLIGFFVGMLICIVIDCNGLELVQVLVSL